MAARILHLFDAQFDWQHRLGVSQLLDNLDTHQFECELGTLSDSSQPQFGLAGRQVTRFPFVLDTTLLTAPLLRRFVQMNQIDIIHAWGIAAAFAATQADAKSKLVIELFDPIIRDEEAAKLRLIQERSNPAIACATATVRRRLAERGVDVGACVVLRPGVDFAAINTARKRGLRERLGVAPGALVVLTPEPVSRRWDAFAAFWMIGLRSIRGEGDCLLLPGCSGEKNRIERLAQNLELSHCLRATNGTPFEEVIPHADVLLLASAEDVSATAIAWAMAAGVPVVATAVYSTAEFIASRTNGLLIKPDASKRMAVKLAKLLDDRQVLNEVRDTARGQAFEVFSVRRYVDQHVTLYQNIQAGQSPGGGIHDPAQNM